jgi:hypothetical protein
MGQPGRQMERSAPRSAFATPAEVQLVKEQDEQRRDLARRCREGREAVRVHKRDHGGVVQPHELDARGNGGVKHAENLCVQTVAGRPVEITTSFYRRQRGHRYIDVAMHLVDL